MNTINRFNNLPWDIQVNIAKFLPPSTLGKSAATSKHWLALMSHDRVWKHLPKKYHITQLDPFEPIKGQFIQRITALNSKAANYISLKENPSPHPIKLLFETSKEKTRINNINDQFEKFEAIRKFLFEENHLFSHDTIFPYMFGYSDLIPGAGDHNPPTRSSQDNVDLITLFVVNLAANYTALNTIVLAKIIDTRIFKVFLEGHLAAGTPVDQIELFCDAHMSSVHEKVDTLFTAGISCEAFIITLIDDVIDNFFMRRRGQVELYRPEFSQAFALQICCKYLSEKTKKEVIIPHIDARRREFNDPKRNKFINNSHIKGCKLRGCDLVVSFVKGETLFSKLNLNEHDREIELKEQAFVREIPNNSLEDDVIRLLSIIDYFGLAIFLKHCTPSDKEKLLKAVDFAEKESLTSGYKPNQQSTPDQVQDNHRRFERMRAFIKTATFQQRFTD